MPKHPIEAALNGKPIRTSVMRFAAIMEVKLRENDHKGGWTDEPWSYLFGRMIEESGELFRELMDIDRRQRRGPHGDVNAYREVLAAVALRIAREAADVANIAHMLAHQAGALGDDLDENGHAE